MNTKIVIIAVDCQLTNILYNSLKEEFEIEKVLIEQPISKHQFISNRVKRLGLYHVIGQILFRLFIVPFLKLSASKRVKELKSSFHLSDLNIISEKILHVASINSPIVVKILKELNPGLVIINGTRIIKKEILESIPAKFLNIHTGITPQYRGVHGGYWALVDENSEACGVTIHFIDKGIDTGAILKQGIIKPIESDNFITYPFMQFGIGLPLLKEGIKDIFDGRDELLPPSGNISKLWSHPTLVGYLRKRIFNNVK